MRITNIIAASAFCVYLLCSEAAVLADVALAGQALTGSIVDDKTGKSVAARLYVEAVEGRSYFAASNGGHAIRYRKQRGRLSSENHTSLSAHPFTLTVPPGEYVITVERGKEYVTWQKTVTVKDRPLDVPIRLRRWINMAKLGWYSGDTHVHRKLEELPLVMLSEDLNVALPLTDWVTTGHQPPRSAGDPPPAKLIIVDPTHVIYPRNTEYEIFRVGKKSHTLGAVFILNHKERFTEGVPPVAPIAAKARQQGALLELDKHSWPWSMMLVPVMKVDLFELLNNHVWRTRFGFASWTSDIRPDYMQLETDARGFTEWGWIDFGLQQYYALLDCGFRMRVTAGTASGVHPVPLGFSRVYVHLPGKFSYDAWIKGLGEGRSFVSNGPALVVKYNGQYPGHTFADLKTAENICHITGTAAASQPLDRIEIIVNGEVVEKIVPEQTKSAEPGYRAKIDVKIPLSGSSWVAVRCFAKHHAQRIRIAHTNPVFFDVPGKPLRPKKAAVDYLIARMKSELKRNTGVLTDPELAEYRQALAVYQKLRKTAR